MIIVRSVRALVIALAVAWLALVLRMSPAVLAADETVVNRISRGVLHRVLTCFLPICSGTWRRPISTETGGSLARRGEQSVGGRAPEVVTDVAVHFPEHPRGVFGHRRRSMVLSGLGVAIGPLIAGAGIFGVAIGFGSQTLVKDIVSGVFYMMDDAFRVGEYIQSGSYKGTVESFSLRSVRLRHHHGPVFTVPFGELGAVQNMSRDWAIDKFLLRVPFNTDVAKAKKIIKEIGEQLKEDPEIGPHILETLKMKGVEQFGDFGIELSFAFIAHPGRQSDIRRQAYTMIRDAFVANGIEFAHPTVQVGGDEKAAAASAASTTGCARQKAMQSVTGEA